MEESKTRSIQENVARLLEQGIQFDKKKEYANAAAAYKAALKMDPDNILLTFKLGWSEYKAGSVNSGLVKMKKAIEEGVDDADSLGKLGEVLMREGPEQDLDHAERLLKESVDKDPEVPETLVWLGRVCEKKGNMEEARGLYQRAVECPNCTMVDAFFYLGVICEKQKDYKKAILHLKTCL